MELIFFALFNPWHTTWLAVVVGIVLVALAALAIRTAIRSKAKTDSQVHTRTLYSMVSGFLIIAGITMVMEGLSLGSHMNAVAHPPSYAVQKAAYDAHNWPMPSPVTSMLNVYIVLMLAVVGTLIAELLRQTDRKELFGIAVALVVATATVGVNIMQYHFYMHIFAVLTFIMWMLTIAAIGDAVYVVLQTRTKFFARAKATQ